MRVTSFLLKVVPPLIPAIVVSVALELLVRGGVIQPYLVPRPSTILRTLFTESDIWTAAGRTGFAAGVGFLASAVAGMLIAIALSSARWLERSIYPYAIFFQTVPIVAIAPLLVIWIGFDIRTVIWSALIVSIFPVIANTLAGLLSTDPALRDLFRLYGAGWFATLFKLRLPAAMPAVFTGLRVAGGLAVIGAVVGEFITGTGIGDVIAVSRQQQKIEKVFAVLLLAAGLGIVLFGAINLLGAIVLRHWHPSEGKR